MAKLTLNTLGGFFKRLLLAITSKTKKLPEILAKQMHAKKTAIISTMPLLQLAVCVSKSL